MSVVIPSRGRPELIRRSVSTVLAQRGVSLELIVVDDGSDVPVAAVLMPDERLRVVRNELSRGVSMARNQGVAVARGRWIAFLDDDDLWAVEKLARQIAQMEEHGVRWSYTGCYFLDADLNITMESSPPVTVTDAALLRRYNAVGTPSSVVVAADLLREAGGFDSTFAVLADWDLWIRLASVEPAAALKEPLVGYVRHPGSMHRQGVRGLIAEYRRLKAKHRARGAVGGPMVWKWIALADLATGHRIRSVALFVGICVASPRKTWRDRADLGSSLRRVIDRRWGASATATAGAPPTPWSPGGADDDSVAESTREQQGTGPDAPARHHRPA